MQIYIPSTGRAWDQHTLKQIPRSWRSVTALVVPVGEQIEYSAAAAQHGVTVIPCPHKGIGATRQFIVAACYPEEVLMLDDDLTFFKRSNTDRTKFVDADEGDVEEMLNEVAYQVRHNPHVGVCAREGGNRYPNRYYYNVRLLRALAYDTIVLSSQGIRFDQIPVMEDFHVSLNLLTRGHTNMMLSDWCHNQKGSNAEGGCSQYRTMDVQKRAALQLKDEFPDFVSVVTKRTKTAWGGQERTDVRIQWKKAYTSSQ